MHQDPFSVPTDKNLKVWVWVNVVAVNSNTVFGHIFAWSFSLFWCGKMFTEICPSLLDAPCTLIRFWCLQIIWVKQILLLILRNLVKCLLQSYWQLVKRQSQGRQGCVNRVRSYLNTNLTTLNHKFLFCCIQHLQMTAHTISFSHTHHNSSLTPIWTASQ